MTATLFTEPLQNICLLYGFFGGLIGSLCLGWLCFPSSSPQATLATIDLQGLVSKEQGTLSERSQERMLEQSVTSLGQDLEIFAKQHNLILLREGTVAGGDIADKTAAFLAWLEARKQGEQP